MPAFAPLSTNLVALTGLRHHQIHYWKKKKTPDSARDSTREPLRSAVGRASHAPRHAAEIRGVRAPRMRRSGVVREELYGEGAI